MTMSLIYKFNVKQTKIKTLPDNNLPLTKSRIALTITLFVRNVASARQNKQKKFFLVRRA